MSAATTRREAEALRRLRALLLAGSPFDAAVWDATGHGRDLDTARLVGLYRQHRPADDDAQGGRSMSAPAFHDPDHPGRLLALVAAVPGLPGWVLVRPVGDDRPAAAFRALLADLTPATSPP